MTYLPHDFTAYASYLNPLADQLELLRKLNRRMPNELRLPEAWLDINGTSDHVQGMEDLICLFVQLETPELTWAFNQELVRLTQPAVRDSGFARTAAYMRLHPLARRYAPGVHIVRINLVAHWEPLRGRSVDQVRQEMASAGQQLAGIEAIGAYALQDPWLYQLQDGEHLPFFDCAGLQQSQPKEYYRFTRVPYLLRRPDGSIYCSTYWAGGVLKRFAAPVLV